MYARVYAATCVLMHVAMCVRICLNVCTVYVCICISNPPSYKQLQSMMIRLTVKISIKMITMIA